MRIPTAFAAATVAANGVRATTVCVTPWRSVAVSVTVFVVPGSWVVNEPP
jgi:hypothetical protein